MDNIGPVTETAKTAKILALNKDGYKMTIHHLQLILDEIMQMSFLMSFQIGS